MPATSLGGGSYAADLARIRAELDAKARGHNYGLKTRSSRRVIQRAFLRSQEESDSDSSDDDNHDVMNGNESGDEDGGSESEEETLTRRRAASASRKQIHGLLDPTLPLPRGVTQRPSGKWQVQGKHKSISRNGHKPEITHVHVPCCSESMFLKSADKF